MKLKFIQKFKLAFTSDKIMVQDKNGKVILKCIDYNDGEVLTHTGEVIPYEETIINNKKKFYLSNIAYLPMLELAKARAIIESHLIKRLTREKLTLFEMILVLICMSAFAMAFFTYKEIGELSNIIQGV